jgi:hypothetical protein
MSLGRLVILLVVLALVVWLLKSHGTFFGSSAPASGPSAPLERARAVAAQSQERNAQIAGATREADSINPGAGVSENMTPDQVRALLGAPDEIATLTSESGVPQERWTYRSVGRTVLFENGIAVSVR